MMAHTWQRHVLNKNNVKGQVLERRKEQARHRLEHVLEGIYRKPTLGWSVGTEEEG